MSTNIETLDPKLGDAYRPSWIWFLGFGTALLALGLSAFGHLTTASVISTFIVGAIMLIGGILGLGHAFCIRHPDRHHFWIFGSGFYGLAGGAILVEPVLGGSALTLLMAVGLGLSGLCRIIVGAQLQSNAILISGTASLMAATVIGVGWSEDALWVIGYCVAIDLLFQGLMLLFTGMTLHRVGRSPG